MVRTELRWYELPIRTCLKMMDFYWNDLYLLYLLSNAWEKGERRTLRIVIESDQTVKFLGLKQNDFGSISRTNGLIVFNLTKHQNPIHLLSRAKPSNCHHQKSVFSLCLTDTSLLQGPTKQGSEWKSFAANSTHVAGSKTNRFNWPEADNLSCLLGRKIPVHKSVSNMLWRLPQKTSTSKRYQRWCH